MKYKLVKKLSGHVISGTACRDEFEKFVKKFGYYTEVEWTSDVEDYCIEQNGWIEFLFREGYLNKNKKTKGYFNGINTWEGAIKKMQEADNGYECEFEVVNGNVCLDLCISAIGNYYIFLEEGQDALTS